MKKINIPLLFTVFMVILVVISLFSITKGAADISLNDLINTFKHFDKTNPKHLLVLEMRIPRIISSLLVGVALSTSGAIMQGITRNPLADSGLMGLSSGAGFVVAIVFAFFSGIPYLGIVGLTFLGAAGGAALVFGISSAVPGGDNSMKLILSGAAISIMLSALSQGIAYTYDVAQNVMFWTLGSVSGASWQKVLIAAPFIIIPAILSNFLSKEISIINMGEEVAIGIGVKVTKIRNLSLIIVVLLTGASYALAGMITFVGMIIPHICRFILGPDYRLIIPFSGVLGAILVVSADIGSKTINSPGELPLGAIIALVGVPFFLYLSKRRRA